ncbi:MAG: condensation domain-containing protein [Acidobacteriota bacterium]
MSFSQQRIWFFEQMEPGSRVFQRPSRLRLRGPLRLETLAGVLREIVRRHEPLRTVIRWNDASLEQIVLPAPADVALPFEDLSGLPEPERERRLREREEEDARPFDLARGPLWRARLVRWEEDDHRLLWNVHHAVFDAWSMTVLVAEIEALSEAFAAGRPSALPEPSLPYREYARRQRERMRRPEAARQLAWWKRKLAGAPVLLDLPSARPRPARESFGAGFEDVSFGVELSARLKALARSQGVTIFMAALALFQVLLARRSGRRDFLLGVPVAGRGQVDTENLIGCFINTVVLRADLSGDVSFSGLLRRVRTAALKAYENQDVPFERVVQEVQPKRSANHPPLFQMMMNFRNVPRRPPGSGPLTVGVEPAESRVAMVDLEMDLVAGAGEIGARFVYATDLFETDDVVRLGEELRALAERVATDPECLLTDLLSGGAAPAPGSVPAAEAAGLAGPLPDDAVERRIASLLAGILGVAQMAADDDFFDRGGDSLLVIRAISRIRDAFGIEIPVREFFESSTAAGLARRVEARPRPAR